MYATTPSTGDCCIVYSALGFLPRVVCFECATIATSKLDNCNEVDSQLPHRTQFQGIMSGKIHASEITFWSLAECENA